MATPWSHAVCFAGVGPGEVVRGQGKVVGMAARRTRHWALFQCAVPLLWDPRAYVDLLGLPAAATGSLASVASPVAAVDGDALVARFCEGLPT